jgi:hypothetical protein
MFLQARQTLLPLLAGLASSFPRSGVAQSHRGAPPAAQSITVVTRDFAFEMPDSVPAGLTTFRLRNEGRQPHHLMLYRLDSGKNLEEVLAALNAGGAHPPWMHAAGGPNAVPHGGESIGTVLLQPGMYVAFCHVKSPDQTIHFMRGMIKSLVVTPTAGHPASLPRADLTITLTEYAFSFSRPPTRGWHRIAVRNRGTQPHELILSRLAPGKTSRDFIAWMNTQEGPPPVTPFGGVTDLPAGGSMVIELVLTPGAYSVVCRVRDLTDDQPHDQHGMYTQFVVP